MVRRILLAFSICALLGAAPLSQHDRDFAMSHLHSTRKLFLDSIANLTPEQWNFKPAPDRWSIAECAEHITVSEGVIWDGIQKMLNGPAASPEMLAQTKGKDEKVVELVPDRSSKFKAPEALVPQHRWRTPEEVAAHFKQLRDAHIAWVDTTEADLRDHAAPHPAMGPLDAYQWVLLMSAHTQRHVEQIDEVKADPKFPK